MIDLLDGGALPMSVVNYIWLYFWIAPHLLLLVVAGLMFRRGLHKSYPVFFLYLLCEFLKSFILFAMFWLKVRKSIYVEADLLARASSIALHFGILQELFAVPVARGVFPQRNINHLLNWVTGIMIALASAFIWATYYSSFGLPMVHAYIIVEALTAAQCGLLILVFLWHSFLGVRMAPMSFGISLGLGMGFGLEPFLLVLKNHVSRSMFRSVDIVQMAVFHIAVLVWIYATQVRENVAAASEVNQAQWTEQVAKFERLV